MIKYSQLLKVMLDYYVILLSCFLNEKMKFLYLSFLAIKPFHAMESERKSYTILHTIKVENKPSQPRYYFETLLREAKNGNREFQFLLSEYYRENKNETERLKWLNLSAFQEYPQAQYHLTHCYLEAEEIEKALNLLECSASQGIKEASYTLGSFHLNRKHYSNAIIWLKKALKQGVEKAKEDLAKTFVKNNQIKEALNLYQQEANEGTPKAQNIFGSIHLVNKNYPEAIIWFEKAAKQGFNLAIKNIAIAKQKENALDSDTKNGNKTPSPVKSESFITVSKRKFSS